MGANSIGASSAEHLAVTLSASRSRWAVSTSLHCACKILARLWRALYEALWLAIPVLLLRLSHQELDRRDFPHAVFSVRANRPCPAASRCRPARPSRRLPLPQGHHLQAPRRRMPPQTPQALGTSRNQTAPSRPDGGERPCCPACPRERRT